MGRRVPKSLAGSRPRRPEEDAGNERKKKCSGRNSEEEHDMTIDDALRMIAGAFVLLSVALGYFASPAWFLFTAFVGANLLQSAFTKWCPMMWLLQKLGLPATRAGTPAHQNG